MLSFTRLFPGIECRADGLGRRDRGDLVGNNDPKHLWPTRCAVSLNVCRAGERLNDGIVNPLMRIGTVFAKTADGHIDQLLVEFAHYRLSKTHALHRSGSKVLQQHIGAFGQIKQNLFTFVRFKVYRDRLLTAVAGKKRSGDFIDGWPNMAHLLTRGRLDLNHLCALVGQHHGRYWPRHHAGEIQYLDALQCAHAPPPNKSE